MKSNTLHFSNNRGFSLVELVWIIALVGLLSTVLVMNIGSQNEAVSDVKLESDVRQLNQMVKLYTADGGNLTGVTRLQDVMAKLKNFRTEASIKGHTGSASGRFLDARLEPVIVAGEAGKKRAVWNAAQQKFLVVETTQEGAASFKLDPTKANQSGQAETRREAVVRYDTRTGPTWVWGSVASQQATPTYAPTPTTTRGATQPFNPEAPNPNTTPGGGGGSGGGGSGGGGGGGGGGDPEEEEPVTPPLVPLPSPIASPGGGTYPHTSFPSQVTLSSNGAPAGSSTLRYRINGGAWQDYTGSPFNVSPGDVVSAQNVAVSGAPGVSDSGVITHEYYRLLAGLTGSVTPSFNNAAGGDNMVSTIEPADGNQVVFRHGDTQLDLGNGQVLDAGVENVITFNAQPFSAIAPNNWFNVGDITMLNGNTFNDSEATSVTLSLNFTLTDPAFTGSASIELGLISTPNSSDRMASADIVQLMNARTDFTMTFDGITYRLEVGWESTDPAAGLVQGTEFLIFEGGQATGRLRGRFVSNR